MAAMVFAASIEPGAAQSVIEKREKREKFGSSLSRFNRSQVDAAKPIKKKSYTATDADDIRINTLLVVFDVLVTDNSSRVATGLTKDDFVVVEDGQQQQISLLARGDDARLPRSIILIFDFSGSIAPYLEKSIEAAKKLVGQLGPQDEMAIVNDEVELMVDFTRDKAKLRVALDSIKKRGRGPRGSLQFSALFATLRELIDRRESRPIIIFQTDGDEALTLKGEPYAESRKPRVEYGIGDIYAELERSRATVYTVIPSDRAMGLSSGKLLQLGRKWFGTDSSLSDEYVQKYASMRATQQTAAAKAAELAGGWTEFLGKPDEADNIYARILSDINNRYVIGYYPAIATGDGRFRKVQIEVKTHPDYKVHGRKGYYAPTK